MVDSTDDAARMEQRADIAWDPVYDAQTAVGDNMFQARKTVRRELGGVAIDFPQDLDIRASENVNYHAREALDFLIVVFSMRAEIDEDCWGRGQP